jgi:hypothetical protein
MLTLFIKYAELADTDDTTDCRVLKGCEGIAIELFITSERKSIQ